MSNSPNGELVTDALLMAFQRRRPDRRVVHHSDRGAAYTSLAFSQRVTELELEQSFGSTGDCYDNAAVEAFWATADDLGASRRPPPPHPTPAGTTLSRLKLCS